MVFSPPIKFDRKMAVLNKIRQRSVFLIVIIALALFSFVLADVIRNGGLSSNKSQTTVATVNGNDIPRQEFMEQVEATQRTLGPNGTSAQAMNIVWERELRSILLEEQYEKIGLSAEEEQINNAMSTSLATNPSFQNEAGMYDPARVREYVASIRSNPQLYSQWTEFVKNTKRFYLENTYLTMIKAGMTSTLNDGQAEYRFENDKINIDYVQIPYAKIADEDITVSDADIKKYMNEHPKKFEVEPQVDIQYVLVSEAPSEDDIEASRTEVESLLKDKTEYSSATNGTDTIYGFRNTKDIQAFVDANSSQPYTNTWLYKKQLPKVAADTLGKMNKGDIYGPYKTDASYNISKIVDARQMPDTVSARHILIPIGLNPTDSITRTDLQAKATADSLMKVVKGNRSKFTDLVKAFSSDSGSMEKEGKYEDFAYNTMVAEFRDFAFENKVGDIGVVKTQFGYHLIEVTDQKNMQKVYKVATISKEVEPSENTLNDVFSTASKFEVASKDGDFAKVAGEQGLEVKPVNKIGKLDTSLPGITSSRNIISWGFKEDTNIGDIKRFSVPNGYVIAQLTRRNKKEAMSVSEASTTVTPILRNQKKAKKIRESISGNTLEEIAANQSVTVKTEAALTRAVPTIAGVGNEPEVVGAAFGVKAGETTGLIDGKTGVFKVKVLEVNQAPDIKNYASYAEQLNAIVTPKVNTGVYNALKNEAEIEDNRANFF